MTDNANRQAALQQQGAMQHAFDHYSGMPQDTRQHHQYAYSAPRPYDSADAVFGEVLRELLHATKRIELLREAVAELRAEIRARRAGEVLTFPVNALRHGTPT